MTLKQKFFNVYTSYYKKSNELDKMVEVADDYAIDFYNWMRKNDTPENAEKWFGYSDQDMLNEFKKEKGL